MKRQDSREKLGKVELLKKSREAYTERQNLISQIKLLKIKYQGFLDEFRPKIDNLQSVADSLAAEFKRLYGKSKETYSEGNGALAKVFSIQGHAVQDRCEAINVETNALRAQFQEILNQIDNLRNKAEELKSQFKDYREKANALRLTPVRGFNTSKIISNEEIEKFLDEFPQSIFKEVKSIEYDENLFWESAVKKIRVESRGFAVKSQNGKMIIKIGKQLGGTINERIEKLREVVTHEIGHALYKKFLTDEQKAEWFVWHMQDTEKGKFITNECLENDEEDFTESFRIFKSEPEKLQKHDERRYNLIKELMEKLDHEKT